MGMDCQLGDPSVISNSNKPRDIFTSQLYITPIVKLSYSSYFESNETKKHYYNNENFIDGTNYFFVIFILSVSAASFALLARIPTSLALARAIRIELKTLIFFSSSVTFLAFSACLVCSIGWTFPCSWVASASSAAYNDKGWTTHKSQTSHVINSLLQRLIHQNLLCS